MSEAKQRRKHSLKGAVLFTVLVVLVVVIVILLVTIGLAGIASRSAYSQYNDLQTTNTARSLVESTIESFGEGNTNQDLGQAIVDDMVNNGVTTVPVNVNVTGLNGYGTVNSLVFTYVGLDTASPGADHYNITGSDKPIIRITATVSQGGQTSTYSQYVIGDFEHNNRSGGGGGFVALGGYNGSGTSPDLDAPAYVGIAEPFNWDSFLVFKNKAKSSNFVINSSAYMGESGAEFNFKKNDGAQKDYSGIYVEGNFVLNNNPSFKSNFEPESDDITNIPFINVGGTFYLAQSTIGGASAPINVYAGRIISDKVSKVYGDIFCYNTGTDAFEAAPYTLTLDGTTRQPTTANQSKTFGEKSWSYMGGDGLTELLKWASKNASGVDFDSSSDFYTLGSLALKQSFNFENSEIYVGQDFRAADDIRDSKLGKVIVKGAINLADPNGKLGTGFEMYKAVSADKYVKLDLAQYKTGNNLTINIAKNASTADVKSADAGKEYSLSEISAVAEDFANGTKYSKTELKTKVMQTPDKIKDQFIGPDGYKDAILKSEINVATAPVYKGNGTGSIDEWKGGDTWDAIAGTKSGEFLAANFEKYTGTSGTMEATNGFSYNLKITSDCTLVGNFDKKVIYIDATGKSKLWVNMYDVELSNNTEIIVNDNNGNSTVVLYMPTRNKATADAGGVYNNNSINYGTAYNSDYETYVIPSDCQTGSTISGETYYNKFVISNATPIMTYRYYSAYKLGQKLNLVTFPSNDSDTTNDWMIPGIKIASADNIDTVGTPAVPSKKDNVYIEFGAGAISITADILTPKGSFKQEGSGGAEFTGGVDYNGNPSASTVACIGSIIVNKILGLQNDYKITYVDDPIGGPPPLTDSGIYKWQPIEGYADF